MRVGIAPAGTKTSAATIRWLLKDASDKGTEVYAVYRDLTKVPAEFKACENFTAVQGDVEDAESLDFTSCDAVFTSTPPCFDGSDPIKKAELLAQNVKTAVERAGVKRLILLSSVGAEFSEGVVSGALKDTKRAFFVDTHRFSQGRNPHQPRS
jgi:putative NADH-flavin reductase